MRAIWSSPLLRLIQTPSELKTFVSVYLTIILASLPAAFLYNLYGALLRAIGRANAALMVLAAAVTVNVALDYCFVARFQLGIAGAAWATAASQAISAVLRVVLSWLLVGKMGLPAVALATGLGWVLVNALWTFVKWRMEKKQKAAERDIM